jgi:peptidoglycan hydrolase-like protein with peptidoglycan-binding domain
MTPSARVGAAVAFALVVGAAGGWATTELLAAPPPLAAGPRYLVATAAEGSVQRQIGLDAKAVWSGGSSVLGARSGTVTGVRISGATTVASGEVVYEVDLSPVTVAPGLVPAFRDLRVGDSGADVRQLQALLTSVGVRRDAPDGTFGPATAAQVKAWQQRTGQTPTGTVAHGAILFVPRLPATLAVADGLQTGSLAPVGVPVLRVLPSAPTFTIALPANQASLTKSGMGVTLAYGDARWSGRIADLGAAGPDGTVTATIGPATGHLSVCGSTCGKLPPGGGTVSADIEVVPLTRGVAIPSQALALGSDGRAAVVSADGRSISVTVRAVSGGVAVVDGLEVGRQIRIPTGG